jgi:glycosyltransferase involved in cell wall biosynthesis
VLDLPKNVGKGEAVRQGILVALASEVDYIGYWDADLATPLDAIPTFCTLLDDRPDLEIVMGARVRLLGRTIERNPLRHCLGRVFAIAASTVLGMGVYDTQCGAKLLRNSELVASIFQQPFLTKWLFDVEILARLTQIHQHPALSLPATKVYEFPLQEWRDVADSKVKAHNFFMAFIDLAIIYHNYFMTRKYQVHLKPYHQP